jgi:hypothetical protein
MGTVSFWKVLFSFLIIFYLNGYRGTRWRSCSRHYTTSQKVADSSPDEAFFFNWPNPSSRTMALGSTQPLTEMSTRNLPGGKGRPARKADNLTAICEPIVQKLWEPRRFTVLWAVTVCYRDSIFYLEGCMRKGRRLGRGRLQRGYWGKPTPHLVLGKFPLRFLLSERLSWAASLPTLLSGQCHNPDQQWRFYRRGNLRSRIISCAFQRPLTVVAFTWWSHWIQD